MMKCDKNVVVVYLYALVCLFFIFFPVLKKMGLAFGWLDEVFVLVLFFFMLLQRECLKNKNLIIVFFALLFFVVYSLLQHITVAKAVFLDFFLFCKPLIALYATCLIPINISRKKNNKIRCFFLFSGILCWVYLATFSLFDIDTKEFYPICLVTSFGYLLFSNRSPKDKIIVSFFLLPALLYMLYLGGSHIRSKYLCELIAFVFVYFFSKGRIRLNLKYLIISVIAVLVMLYASWNKFNHYFVDTQENVARTAFYITSFKVVRDYFPLGPGFGTYATEAAARYYSPLYYKYNLYKIWGLSPSSYGQTGHNFLTDTFYPILAEFGVAGPTMWILFWFSCWKFSKNISVERYKIFVFGTIVMMVQCVAANSFTGPIGVAYMMTIGLSLNHNFVIKEKNDT